MADITGDQHVQSQVLEGLATAVNHRQWFVELALPYLGNNPIEIGSGLGDYALEWARYCERFTATEADPVRLIALKERLARHPDIEVRQMLLPTSDEASYTAALAYNVLEHIEDDRAAAACMGGAGPPRRRGRDHRAGVPVRDEPGRRRHRARPPLHGSRWNGCSRTRACGSSRSTTPTRWG